MEMLAVLMAMLVKVMKTGGMAVKLNATGLSQLGVWLTPNPAMTGKAVMLGSIKMVAGAVEKARDSTSHEIEIPIVLVREATPV